MTTENKRDLASDLAICEAATAGPAQYMRSVHSEYDYEICRPDFFDTIIASAITEKDAKFIAESFEGWPEAIRRAMAAEAEVARLRSELMIVFQRANNDVRKRDGGMSVGTNTFADYPFARRLVRDLEPILFPEVSADATQENNG